MRKLICTLLSVVCVLSIAVFASACGAKLEEFTANEDPRYVEIGETFSVPRPTAKDSKGNFLVPTVTAKDPDGADVEVTNYSFKPAKVGMYEITYTVTVGKTTESKSFELEVYDETAPLVDIDLEWYNITVPGTTFDTTVITASDNSGEAVTPEVKVYFNDEEVALDNGVVTFSEIGTYKVSVSAEDSSGNEEHRDYVVWTNVSYEDDVYVENQFYANGTSTDFARHGEKAMKIDLFANQSTYNWFNDVSMLGEIYFYGNTEENPFTHVSYWIYFDTEALGVNATANINGEWYATTVYDIYGREVAKNWQGKYEFVGNTWYRIVSDITTVVNPVDHSDAAPITSCLQDYGMYLGLWNITDNNNTFTRSLQTYIDDIRIIDPENDNEVYDELPEPPKAEYEKGERLAYAKFVDMVYFVGASQGEAVALNDENGEALVTYNFKHGMVDGTIAKFDSYATNKLGSSIDTGEGSDPNKVAFANTWQIYSGNNDAFIYEVTATKTVFVDLKAQVFGVDGAEGSTGGWTDAYSNVKIRAFVMDADGNLTKIKDHALTSASGEGSAEVLGILLEAGETLYLEYSFPWSDHRNLQNPPYLNVYQANEIVAE